jgi:diadenosine tetraphosphatase ApaH/serine/threonine PP2A family protein phosphatase
MRYAIFTDIHANLEALEAVLAKIDELSQQEPIDEIWFLGDLVGYGPDPNECIIKLRERTNVIIAGNHDWAAVGKIDLDDFSAAARISAEWTALQLTDEHREFLANLPERLVIGECTLVHGSPYGPLWEYLTSEALAERSFQYFDTRYCFVGHTHIPIIFQQPDAIANLPTIPLGEEGSQTSSATRQSVQPPAETLFADAAPDDTTSDEDEQETTEIAALRMPVKPTTTASVETPPQAPSSTTTAEGEPFTRYPSVPAPTPAASGRNETHTQSEEQHEQPILDADEGKEDREESKEQDEITPPETILSAEERLNNEIEELLALLGLSQSLVKVTNEMIDPPEGQWQLPEGYRAIVNPGGVGQPRDGDPRAAFMIHDTERGFTFYRVPYAIEKTQEKIIKAGLPPYLATRLAYGR